MRSVNQMAVSTASRRIAEQNSIFRGAAAQAQTARWTVPLVIVLLSFVAFSPILHNGFLNWDDEAVLVTNPAYRGLGWTQLCWMFTTFHHSLYRPLTWVTFGLDYLVWGMNPFGYHLTSLLLHCACAVVFYFVAYRILHLCIPLTAADVPIRLAAGFGAMIFSLHPLRVEAVAWASGRENVVSGLFFLLTVLFYLKAVAPSEKARRYRIWMGAAWLAYLLSLLGKAAGMTLPIALLIIDIYPLERLRSNPRYWFDRKTKRVWLEKLAFFALAVGAAFLGWMAKYEAGATAGWRDYGLLPRLGQALYGLWFYLEKMLVPIFLSPLYELPLDLKPWLGIFLLSAVLVVGLSVIFFMARRRWPAGLASWLYYIVILAPVLGLAQSGPQLVADRYSYLACLSWAILAAGGLLVCWQLSGKGQVGKREIHILNLLAVAAIAALGLLSWKQTFVWRDSESLWSHALGIGQRSTVAHYHLGLALERRGQLDDAVRHYGEALEIKPNYLEPRVRLAEVLTRSGRSAEAIEQFRTALESYPADVSLHISLGNLLVARGDLDGATESYRKALEIDSASANGFFNLANVLAMRGDLAGATRNYLNALRIDSTHGEAHFNLANALVTQGQLVEAIDHYRQAVKYKPELAPAHHNLGRVLAAQGRLDEAIKSFRAALQVRPDYAEAQASLRQALAEQK
jgi:tetratricopeptide (TPR) repeat protein